MTATTRPEDLIDDKDAFASHLAETFELEKIVGLMLAMGLRFSDLALALNVHPRTVRAWMESDDRDPGRQRDGILALKALVLFLLRRGILTPRQVAFWLVEPSDSLAFRRPLAVLADGKLEDVVAASTSFTRPVPPHGNSRRTDPSVAAGAAGRAPSGRG